MTSANVACGYHAGTPATMRAVRPEAAGRGVSVGAQVSYDDREDFGRVALDVPYDVLREQVAVQVGTLTGIAVAEGTTVRYLKPHGALYNRVIDDAEQAAAVLAGSGDLPVLGMPGGAARLAAGRGRPGGATRASPTAATDADGRLLPRDRPGALLDDGRPRSRPAPSRLGRPGVDSVCVHGDTPGAVATHARRTPGARGVGACPAAARRDVDRRAGVITHRGRKASWCSYHQVTLDSRGPPACGRGWETWTERNVDPSARKALRRRPGAGDGELSHQPARSAEGRADQVEDDDPHGEAQTLRAAPVTGPAGSESVAVDRTSPSRSTEGLGCSYHRQGPSPISSPCRAAGRDTGQV